MASANPARVTLLDTGEEAVRDEVQPDVVLEERFESGTRPRETLRRIVNHWATRGSVAFAPTLASAACMAAAHAVFWVAVFPANTTMAAWPLEAIPADWMRWRDRWEHAHAGRARLMIVALGARVRSVTR